MLSKSSGHLVMFMLFCCCMYSVIVFPISKAHHAPLWEKIFLLLVRYSIEITAIYHFGACGGPQSPDNLDATYSTGAA